jgi:hypothetical protein
LMSSDLEDLFLLVTITKVVKDQSDHSFTWPGESSIDVKNMVFLSWLEKSWLASYG